MSLSNGVQTVANQSRDQGKTFCVLPELFCDLLEDDFHLNKSYPCTQKPKYKKSLFDLQRRRDYPDSMTGEARKVGCVCSTYEQIRFNFPMI